VHKSVPCLHSRESIQDEAGSQRVILRVVCVPDYSFITAFVPRNRDLEASLTPKRSTCAGCLPEAVPSMRDN